MPDYQTHNLMLQSVESDSLRIGRHFHKPAPKRPRRGWLARILRRILP